MSAGMAKHSESSFDEAKEIRILSDVLESTHKIKTFFKENDRTPNHDGNFELITKGGEPKKQFVVQIKKVSSLTKCEAGKNKGKYVYLLDTSFLYYIKEKVTESPAIYFVVDIDCGRIFYLYLSDNVLMSLDFEGKEHVTYAFSDNEVLSNIDSFYNELLKISNSRNSRFFYKSSSEIAELQEAADYINDLFNTDFKIIKQHCFPNLWRFGIGLTTSGQLEVSCKDSEGKQVVISRNTNANMFGLYPQYKGENTTEFGEYRWNNFGSIIDCSGQGKAIDYTKQYVHKFIQDFCQNPPAKLLPTLVLQERVYKRARVISSIFDSSDTTLLIDNLVKQYCCVFSFLDFVICCGHEHTDGEKQFRRMSLNLLRQRSNCIDIANPFMMSCVKSELNEYYKKRNDYPFNIDRIFKMVSINTINEINDLLELQSRKVDVLSIKWEDSPQIFRSNDIDSINSLYSEYFSQLPNVYYDFYKNIFSRNNEYRFSCKVNYYLFIDEHPYGEIRFIARVNKFKPIDDQIIINNALIDSDEFTETEKSEGVIQKEITCRFCPANTHQHLLYDGVRCWLYQGICNKLGFKIEGINIGGGSNETIFECLK